MLMDNNKTGSATESRSNLFSEYMIANGARIKCYSAVIGPDGNVLRKETKGISPDFYTRLTSPRNACFREKMDSLTLTFRRFDGFGTFPVTMSALEKKTNRTNIAIFSIRFDPQAQGYNLERAESLLRKLYSLEKKSCMDIMAMLTYRKAVIYEYGISSNGNDDGKISQISTLGAEPYIESVFSSRYYDDEQSVLITWENTEAGWLPVVSSIDNMVINHGFLITIPKAQNRIRLFEQASETPGNMITKEGF